MSHEPVKFQQLSHAKDISKVWVYQLYSFINYEGQTVKNHKKWIAVFAAHLAWNGQEW